MHANVVGSILKELNTRIEVRHPPALAEPASKKRQVARAGKIDVFHSRRGYVRKITLL